MILDWASPFKLSCLIERPHNEIREKTRTVVNEFILTQIGGVWLLYVIA